MAAGDEAAAAGLSVVPATADIRQGYAAINTRGDELARHMTSGTHPFTRITGQVPTSKIADGAVTQPKIAAGAVGTHELATSAVVNSRIANGVVTADKIANGNITRAKLAQKYAAGIINVTPGPLGVTVDTGLTGTIAMVVTAREGAFGATYAADPTGTTGQFRIRQWDGETGLVQWIAVEVG